MWNERTICCHKKKQVIQRKREGIFVWTTSTSISNTYLWELVIFCLIQYLLNSKCSFVNIVFCNGNTQIILEKIYIIIINFNRNLLKLLIIISTLFRKRNQLWKELKNLDYFDNTIDSISSSYKIQILSMVIFLTVYHIT